MARLDPHSYVEQDQTPPRHLRLDLEVDFESRRLAGEAALVLAGSQAGPLDLDTKGLAVHEVRTETGAAVPFTLGPEEPVFGRRLRVERPGAAREVRIRYETSPEALGLQWLTPEQTAGGAHPFLFSQCQPIHARTLAPLP
ncbi:MAG TPA: M1 family peptidase, partial [Vicinamibacteria bacterium]|nr:M1 family peptidase [Vicinamibacteria bacterium]